MMSTAAMHTPKENPQALQAKWSEAMDLRVSGRSIDWIARDMGSRQKSKRPYSTATIHRWLDRGMERFAPVREQVAERARSLDLIRIDKRLVILEEYSKRDENGDLPKFNEAIDRAYNAYLKRRAAMLGYDAPSELLIGARAGEMTSAALLIVKRVVQDMLPEEQAGEMLAAMEEQICEYNGEPQAVEAKVKQLKGEG